MTRMPDLAGADQGPFVKVSRRLARKKIAKLTGRETETMLAPLEAYARAPRLLFGIAMLEEATAKLHRMPERLKVLAELKAATLTQCEYCIDIGSQIAHLAGVSEDELLALPSYRDSDLFSEEEKLVLDYAVGMSSTPVSVPDDVFDALRARFDERQIVELTNIIALENMRGRFNLALGIGSSGFREGMVCAVPDTPPSPDTAAPPRSITTAAA
jgi:AhpD family alkylhydroperoxidase